ncbi:MAG: aminopeptidase, partial [Firmicutes bacterium]|nr:aminopeptidase [Bacillota bacterium]
MKKTVLREYAKLIARMGVNVQKGQEVYIRSGLEFPEFTAMVAEECYRLKAKKVVVDWDYQPLEKLAYRYETVKTLGTVPDYVEMRWKHYTENLPMCRIFLMSDDPDGLKGVNVVKMSKGMQMSRKVIKPYRDAMEGNHQWTIAAVPGKKWAKKLFPGLRTSQAVEKLWEEILKAARALGDPVKAWEEHNRDLRERCAYLNGLGIEKLIYKAGNGTDFSVGLIPEGLFAGGSETSRQGIEFNPNMPTEECFTSPRRDSAEGIVYASKPLCYNGQLIEDFWIRFHEGKAVEWHAEKNEALLGELINMDEGAAYLGEAALVPYASPICQSGILFYNTLFDENASCHLALGKAYPTCLDGGADMDSVTLLSHGVNDSLLH